MRSQCRFAELKVQLDQGIQDRTQLRKIHRSVDVSAHREFLTLSWLGDLDYWRSLAIDREAARLHKRPEYKHASKGRLRRIARKDVLDRFAHRQERLHAVERMVFFKTCDLIPEALEKMAPDCVAGYREAPLHRHVVLERWQAPTDKGTELEFSRWRLQPAFHRSAAAVVASLLADIFPTRLPDPRPGPPWWWWLVAVLVSVLLLAGYLACNPEISARLSTTSVVTENDRRDQELADLRSQMEQLLNEQALAGEHLDAEARAHLLRLESELTALSARLAALASLQASETSFDHVGAAACLPVRREGDRVFPTFLYAITLDRDATLSLRPLAEGLQAARERGFTTMPEQAASRLDIAAFEALVRPVSEEARSRSCRHFVLLIENDPQDAGRYIARREAVERHFYVFRP